MILEEKRVSLIQEYYKNFVTRYIQVPSHSSTKHYKTIIKILHEEHYKNVLVDFWSTRLTCLPLTIDPFDPKTDLFLTLHTSSPMHLQFYLSNFMCKQAINITIAMHNSNYTRLYCLITLSQTTILMSIHDTYTCYQLRNDKNLQEMEGESSKFHNNSKLLDPTITTASFFM